MSVYPKDEKKNLLQKPLNNYYQSKVENKTTNMQINIFPQNNMSSVPTNPKNDFNSKSEIGKNRNPLLRGISLEIDEKNSRLEEERRKKQEQEQSFKMITDLDGTLVKLEKSKKHIERLENVSSYY